MEFNSYHLVNGETYYGIATRQHTIHQEIEMTTTVPKTERNPRDAVLNTRTFGKAGTFK